MRDALLVSAAVSTMTLSALAALVLGTVSAWAAAPPGVPTAAPGELRAGQRAVVRTVFQGDSIEEFPAEIVGVLQGGRAEGDLILARATSSASPDSASRRG